VLGVAPMPLCVLLLHLLVLDTAPARSEPPMWGFSPAPDAFLPGEVFREFRADISLVWPTVGDPEAPSPVEGVTNAEYFAREVVARGRCGVPTILHLGFVVGGDEPLAERRGHVAGWGSTMRAEGATPYIHSIIGLDDSNCINLLVPDADERRRAVTGWLTEAFPGKPVGHVLDVEGWGEGSWLGNCGPIPSERFGFAGETIVYAYDFRTDGGTVCTELGGPPVPASRPNADLVVDDLEAMASTLDETEAGLVPIVFFAKGYHARVCELDEARDLTLACFLVDLWKRVFERSQTSPLDRLVAFMGFAWHDQCGPFFWTGFEHSPPLRAAAHWIASHRTDLSDDIPRRLDPWLRRGRPSDPAGCQP
jgi:hypothetical protein